MHAGTRGWARTIASLHELLGDFEIGGIPRAARRAHPVPVPQRQHPYTMGRTLPDVSHYTISRINTICAAVRS